MKRWIRRSFQNRIFVTMLLAALLPLLLCGGLMLRLQVVRSEESMAEQARTQLAGLEDALARFQGDCRKAAAALADSTVVHSALRRGGESSRTLYQVLFRTAAPLRPYARFDIYDQEGACRYTTAGTLPEEALDINWGVLRMAREGDTLAFCASAEGGMTAALAVRNYSGAVLGYVVLSVEESGFARLFEGLYSAGSEVMLLDGRWRAVYCSRPAQADASAKLLRRQLLEGDAPSEEEGAYRVFAIRLEEAGFSLLLQQPRAFTPLVLGAIYLTGLLIGALCLVMSLLCAWTLSRHLSQPVQELDEAMGEVEKGRFDIHLETGREDELGRLAGSFNRMTEEYQANLNRSVQRERELNETKLRMMQAQLNPHFLYNTLDAMKWLGVTHQAPEVAQLATDLAVILRSSISGDEMISLEKELELVERYVDIQSIRFGDRFVCEIDVADRYQSCLVPKLSLQPLVENAILHGVADQEEGYVKLWAGEENGDLLLYVSDNGCGIPPDILESINSRSKQMPDGHLGLNNVDSIIRLHYGQQYGLSASAVPGEGSCVWLRLPIRREEKQDAEGSDC